MGIRPAHEATALLAAALALACVSPPEEAETGTGASTLSLHLLVLDPPSQLPAPEGLSATSGQYRQIPLQWEPVLIPHVSGYLIESADTPEGPFHARAALPHRGVLAWVDTGRDLPLDDGTTRYYRIRAYDHGLRVSNAMSRLAVAATAPPVSPPDGLRAYSRQPRSIPLAWNASSDPVVTGYRIERSPHPEGPFEEVVEIEGRHSTHYLDTGLGNLAVLFYRVFSLDPSGEPGPPSEVLRAVTKPEPLPPVGLAIAAQQLGVNTLRWEPNVEPDLHSYRLLRWREGEEPRSVAWVSAGDTAAEDTRVASGQQAYYALIAVDQDGLESNPSEPIVVEGIGYEWVARANGSGVRLSWNPRHSEGFSGARVSRAGWLGGWTREVEGGELLDETVVSGRRYRYQIQLLRDGRPAAPPSQPIEIEPPEAGEPFVEIRAQPSRLGRPEGIPR